MTTTTDRLGVGPQIAVFLFTAAILIVARMKAPFVILLADRFLAGSGWAEIAGLSIYAVLLLRRFARPGSTSRLRLTIWIVFSIVFFTQFVVGLAGVEKLLMTGQLHVPVPAVVIAGPIFRGGRVFMPILFLSTILLVGPAWCSHLCYIGAWDGLASTARRRPTHLPRAWFWLRIGLFAATPVAAILLRVAGAAGSTAGLVAIGFGICSAGVMAFVSVQKGTMVHCTSVCPLGLAGNLLGKISPFRLRIGESCTECGRCYQACRYDALDLKHVKSRRAGYTCTLCGDCLSSCGEGAISYGFFRLSPRAARRLFLVLAVSLHAVFLGVARI